MQTKPTGRQKFLTGIFQFLWAELKTMNGIKIKSLYKIGVGYLRMKHSKPPKKNTKKILRETSYHLSS